MCMAKPAVPKNLPKPIHIVWFSSCFIGVCRCNYTQHLASFPQANTVDLTAFKPINDGLQPLMFIAIMLST